MKSIKNAISDALGNKSDAQRNASELSQEIRDFISREVARQLEALVDEAIRPELRKMISETRSVEGGEARMTVYSEEEVLPLEGVFPSADPSDKPAEPRPVLSIHDLRLGIDFGTTTTAVSLRIGEEQPQALPIGRGGERYMPSVAYFRAGTGELADRVLVGEDAEAMNDESGIIRSVKRCFGCQGSMCSLQHGKGHRKFPWCTGDGTIRIGEEESILPSQVAYFIIREALQRAIAQLRENYSIDLDLSKLGPVPLNLGCGANFGLGQRTVLLEEARALGFIALQIGNVVEEPILAGFAFSRFSEAPEGRSLIYDFGGGTLDIAVVDVARTNGKPLVTVLSTSGENWLGGDDIDVLVYEEFIGQIVSELNVERSELDQYLELIDRLKLRKMARTAKERLSTLDRFEDSLVLEQLGSVTLFVSRERFEVILESSGLVKNSMDAMLRALKLAHALDIAKTSDLFDPKRIVNLRLEDTVQSVDRVILVGGVTKIPYIRREINRLFGPERVVEERVFDPISAVSIGAAYPKEAEHFSISSPPFGFYLEGMQNERKVHRSLIAPYTYLQFYGRIHNVAVPIHTVFFELTETYHSVILRGKEPLASKSTELRQIGRLEPGRYQFHVGLDGSLILVDRDAKPHELGGHPFTHPLQRQIAQERERRRQKEVEKSRSKTREDDFKSIYGEN